ncbi:helix-turn-helix domain-containing protein [Paenibacillus humicola]|uniref:helix-turn-helix domain-containing protein n=1 Tax=Paenibacillus humicola TaxID=3110540 RepID=UPI00237B7E76|nr:helix-turn-helix domain-containing protein [Paenibacillus humicola]
MKLRSRLARFQVNKLYIRMLLCFLSLLLPIIIVGVIVYVQNIHIQKKELEEKAASNLNFSAKSIDTFLHIAETSETDFLQSHIVQQNLRPVDLLTDRQREQTASIIQQLSFYRAIGSSFIDELFVYLDDQQIYRSDGVETFHDFFEKFNRFDQYPLSFWDSLRRTGQPFDVLAPSPVEKTFYTNKMTVIPLVTVQYLNGRKTAVVADISARAILQTLNTNNVYDSAWSLVLDPKGEPIVSGPGETFTDDPKQLRAIRGRFANPHVKFADMTIGGVSYLVTRSVSATYGWQYFFFIPAFEYKKQATGILSMTVWLCVILLVIGVAFSLLFSRRLYHPIRNIRDILLQQDPLPESASHNEFELIGTGIRRLLENQLRLTRYSLDYVDQLLTALIAGQNPEDKTALHDALQELGFTDGPYQCVAIQLQFNEPFVQDIPDGDRLVMLKQVKKVLWVLLRQELPAYLMEYRHLLFIGVCSIRDPQDREKLRRALDTILRTFDYDLQYCRLYIGIGGAKRRLEELFQSYNEAMTAIAHRPTDSSLAVIDSAELKMENHYYYFLADERRVINCLKVGDPELLHRTVTEIVEVNRQKGVSLRYMGILLTELFYTGNKFLAEQRQHAGQLLSEEEWDKLCRGMEAPFEFEARLQLLHDYFHEIIRRTAPKEEASGSPLVPAILAYIHENYRKDLYLEQIAAEMGVTAKYVSKIFKEKTGTNLTDYLSEVRIREAKAMLVETDLKISEIGECVGIPSRATFFRLFKKSEGVSPHDYRKRLAAEPDEKAN